jgi:hypothetical protein
VADQFAVDRFDLPAKKITSADEQRQAVLTSGEFLDAFRASTELSIEWTWNDQSCIPAP